MLKKMNVLIIICVLSVVLMNVQPAAATNSSANLHPTHIHAYIEYNTPYLLDLQFYMIDPEHNGRPVEVTAYLKDDTNGKTLSFET